MTAVIGSNYPTMPGSYSHPYRNGSYEIYGRDDVAYVRSTPNSTSESYEHRLRHYIAAEHSISYGWGSSFYDYTSAPYEKIVDVWLPSLRFSNRSIQTNFLAENGGQRHPNGYLEFTETQMSQINAAIAMRITPLGAVYHARVHQTLDDFTLRSSAGLTLFLGTIARDTSKVFLSQSWFRMPFTRSIMDLDFNVLVDQIASRASTMEDTVSLAASIRLIAGRGDIEIYRRP